MLCCIHVNSNEKDSAALGAIFAMIWPKRIQRAAVRKVCGKWQ